MVHVTLSETALRSIGSDAVLVPTTMALLRLEGRGAVQCLQGILTNDVADPTRSTVYGALLTPKGMIVTDLWAAREEESFFLLLEATARTDALELIHKQFPPRLATVADWSATHTIFLLIGPESPVVLSRAFGWEPQQAGTLRRVENGIGWVLAFPDRTPWHAAVIVPAAQSKVFADRIEAAGATVGKEEDRLAARILAGWPVHGAEIDEKTLPQEVRFDEIGGVSYSKGCYVGQETVARVHFRGHPNRHLRGLVWTMGVREGAIPDTITSEGKAIGRLTSVLSLPTRRLGLGLVRREIEPGDVVRLGEAPARVVALPFGEEEISGRPHSG